MDEKKKIKYEESSLKRIREVGLKLFEKIEKGEGIYLEIPIRRLSNIVFDKEEKKLVLGEKVAKRYFLNVAHSKRFMQTLLVLSFCKTLLEENERVSLREMFYSLKRTLPNSKENTFDEQRESDAALVDVELILDTIRERLNVGADPKGNVVGDIIIKDSLFGHEINLSKLGLGGWAIPSNVEHIDFKKVNADKVIVIEKNAAWERLNAHMFWKKWNAILIGTKGQAARGARRFIQRLNQELGLPVYVLTDADPYGWYIYSVIKYGSINLAHVSDRLGTPEAKFIGVSMSDIEKYKLQNWTIKAKDFDLKRAKELMKYEWFKHPKWQKEIKKFLQTKRKAEIEAMASKGLKFLSEKYLPEKLKNEDFLP